MRAEEQGSGRVKRGKRLRGAAGQSRRVRAVTGYEAF